MPVETISWKNGKVRYVDQTLLPHKLRYIECGDVRKFWRAIKTLQVRGAPALGIAGALGVLLAVKDSKARTPKELTAEVKRAARYLASSRPTAVNLFWALARMECAARNNEFHGVDGMKKALFREALSMIDEDKKACRAMAEFGSSLINNGDRILTHCNAGGLATADYGTALGVLFEAKARGKRFKVYVDETRPLLQGSRLTTWELLHEGIDTTLICDNMAAAIMKEGGVDKIFVGADRIARNGDAANKIGTYNLAVLAKHHRVPFYIVAPLSSFDFNLKSGDGIPIEERPADEVRTVLGRRIAPKGVKVYNPAFDVTPAAYISAIITEKGISRSPYTKSLKKLYAYKRYR